MRIDDVSNVQAAKFFLSDPALITLGLCDELIVELHEHRTYTPPNCLLKGVYKPSAYGNPEELICIIKYELFTSIAVGVHFYIKTSLQCKGLCLEIQKLAQEYCNKEYPFLSKLQVWVPDPCNHVKKACEKFDMELEGIVKKSVIWRTKVVDLYIYGKDIGVKQ